MDVAICIADDRRKVKSLFSSPFLFLEKPFFDLIGQQ